jgi:PKD repeat protein
MKRGIRLLALLALVALCYGQVGDPTVLSPGFSIHPFAPRVGWDIQFTDLSSGAPVTWLWDFGDGTTSTERNPTHRYTTAGTYEVTLDVSNEAGASASVSRVL